jgi:hypothetical protein
MPFELGLAVAVSSARRRWFVLESKAYRIQRTLSDINGFDPYVHGGTAIGVLRELRNMFRVKPHQPTLQDLRRLQRLLSQRALLLAAQDVHSGVFTASHFAELVVTAHLSARQLGL